MIPGKANLSDHWRGDTWPGMVVTITGLTLAGASAKMQLRDRVNGKKKAEWSTGATNDIAINSGAGTATVDPLILDYEAGTYVYDLEITLADGTVRTVIQGTLKIIDDITRAS